jgi:hypothetical protein
MRKFSYLLVRHPEAVLDIVDELGFHLGKRATLEKEARLKISTLTLLQIIRKYPKVCCSQEQLV